MYSVHFPSENTQLGAAKTVADILTAAADLIEPEGRWTQGVFARDAEGRTTGWREDDAQCLCVAGAISRIGGDPAFNRAFSVFNEWTIKHGFQHLAKWNDAEGRTQAEVVAALRAVAEKARTDSAVGISRQRNETQPPLNNLTGGRP